MGLSRSPKTRASWRRWPEPADSALQTCRCVLESKCKRVSDQATELKPCWQAELTGYFEQLVAGQDNIRSLLEDEGPQVGHHIQTVCLHIIIIRWS